MSLKSSRNPTNSLLHLLIAVTILTAGAACPDQQEKDESTTMNQTAAGSEPTAPPEITLPEHVARGVCLAHVWQDDGEHGYGTSDSGNTLDHLKQLGVDSISVTPFGWMDGLSSTRVQGEHTGAMPDGGEKQTALVEVIDQAHTREMSVVLKPHIWIDDGAWRGDIDPTSNNKPAWDEWWDSYTTFTLYYARLAERHDVDTFVAGVELNSAVTARPGAFKRLIADIREVYNGRVTYAANWDADLPDDLWAQLDSVGVQFYPPLTAQDDPDVATLRREIRPHLKDWNDRARQLDRPLEILEVGFKSAASAVERPWDWPENLDPDERRVDRSLQKRAYHALFAEIRRASQLHSVYIWKYFTDPTRDEGGPLGFSPYDKPAESILRRAYGP